MTEDWQGLNKRQNNTLTTFLMLTKPLNTQ